MGTQQSIFDELYENYKIKRPIRLIELFAGYGSQAFSLQYLKANFESWRICEWNYKSFHAYKCFHNKEDKTDYSKDLSKQELIKIISDLGVSADWNKPMNDRQVNSLSEHKLREIYNDIQATHNLVDVSKVHGKDLAIEREREREHDYILTYSFPCQDLSLAGKMGGLTASRSGLLWEVERILKELTELEQRPDVLLMENVPNVHGETNLKLFQDWMYALDCMGYKNYIEDLSATDYGIPQTRVRAFMVSILGDYNYEFPHKIPLRTKLSDLLENHVDEKYYLSKKMTNYIVSKDDSYKVNENKLVVNRKVACTKTTREGNTRADCSDYIIPELDEEDVSLVKPKHRNKSLKLTLEKNVPEDGDFIDTYNKTVKKDGNSGTITTRVSASNNVFVAVDENLLKIKNATKQGFLEATEGDGIDISGRMQYHRGTVQKGMSQTITTAGGNNVGVAIAVTSALRIRKLTPRECFRLMGVKDQDFEHIKNEFNDSVLYHLAGDSIVVNVLMAIIGKLL